MKNNPKKKAAHKVTLLAAGTTVLHHSEFIIGDGLREVTHLGIWAVLIATVCIVLVELFSGD